MSNHEIITQEASKRDYYYNGSNIHTYSEWLELGYVPARGQRAFIKTRLWTKGVNRKKVLIGLFTIEQVTKVVTKDLISV